jgi:hypothetical protein
MTQPTTPGFYWAKRIANPAHPGEVVHLVQVNAYWWVLRHGRMMPADPADWTDWRGPIPCPFEQSKEAAS